MRQQFWLTERPPSSDKPNVWHLKQVEKSSGFTPPELSRDPIPEALEYLWVWWCRLHAMRTENGMGYSSIGWTEIDAFNRLLGLRMKPVEVELLEVIELEFRRHAHQIEVTDDDTDDEEELPLMSES